MATEQEIEDHIEEKRSEFVYGVFDSQDAFDKFDNDYELLQDRIVREAIFNCLQSQQGLSAEAFAESIMAFATRIFNEHEIDNLTYEELEE